MTSTKPRRWLITGGAGFIGSNLIRVLCEKKLAAAIRVIDDLSVGNEAAMRQFASVTVTPPDQVGAMETSDGVELIVGTVTDPMLASRVSQGAEVVVHLAANTGVQNSLAHPAEDARKNVFGTLNYLEAARSNPDTTFVNASSGAVTGRAAPPIHEGLLCKPVSPYGASKLAAESYCHAYNKAFGLRTVSMRFSNVYGIHSGHKGSVVATLIRAALRRKTWIINGDGSQTRDFIYIDDLILALISASGADVGGEVFQISTGQETSILSLAEKLARLLKEELNIDVSWSFGEPLQGEVARNYADNSKARRLLDWHPTMTLEDGLRRTVRWFGERAADYAP
jgi:UDP-glucose 4-epimerase